ncbi:F-box/kelch-repeat protein At5g15710-like isoform X2 [Salvia splendens]|uniref:F-box/kelch-repeat protein At5g15710-like isoform X2 n=1 Tax=Salvia splendens TaxID=180675 RepID=UPI001C259B28|nr:F-box/kelch-repeat protein At5g15710-like isoform X2 [Salvia splendens]
MWSNLPIDLLANIFSYLPPDSLARARATCKVWRATAELAVPRNRHPPWFLALPARSWGLTSCYAHNPIEDSWHKLDLDRGGASPPPLKPIAAIGGLILMKLASATQLQLAICNPFTAQFRALPALRVARTNPAVGVVAPEGSRSFRIYVAGGMSEAGGAYEPTVEVYDSAAAAGEWRVAGEMPVEFAVRLTVWTPNESVYSGDGMLYWMTSARAYSVMGFDISSNRWREVGVPMADRLEFAALVRREGKVPVELGMRLLGEKMNWGCVKCVGIDGMMICLYKDLGSGIIVWTWSEGKWGWVHGCSSIPSIPIKGILLLPHLATSSAVI